MGAGNVVTGEDMFFQGELPERFVQRVVEGKPIDLGRVAVALAGGSSGGSASRQSVSVVNKRLRLVDSDDDVAGDLAVLDQLSYINWEKAATAWANCVQEKRPADYGGVMVHLQRCKTFAAMFQNVPNGYKRYHRKVAALAHQAIQVRGRRFDWTPECSMARLQVFSAATVGQCAICGGGHETEQHREAITGTLAPPPLGVAPTPSPEWAGAGAGGGVKPPRPALPCHYHNDGPTAAPSSCVRKKCVFVHACRSCGAADHVWSDARCPKRSVFLAAQ